MMMINLKSFGLAIIGLLTAGMLDPAWGITVMKTLQEFIDLGATGETVGDFTFSDFTATGPDTTSEEKWLDFNVTLSDGGGSAPSLVLSPGATLGTLDATDDLGGYTLTYLLTSNTALAFSNFEQLISCSGCDQFTSTEIFQSSGGTFIAGIEDGGQTDLVKGGSPKNPIYVDVLIDYQGGDGNYTGFTQNIEAVPFESDVLPLVGATLLFGGGIWWKRRRAAASQLDLTQPGPEQESGQE